MPWRSVNDNILPPVNYFNILAVAAPTCLFLVFAPTAIPITGAKVLTAGFKNLFQAVWDPIKIFFFILFLKPAPSNRNWIGLKVICFWQLHLGSRHISCNFKTVQFLFKSHYAEFDIAYLCQWVHLAFLIKSRPLVIYLVKIWLLLWPQISHFVLIILKSFLVLVFTFSYWVILLVLL